MRLRGSAFLLPVLLGVCLVAARGAWAGATVAIVRGKDVDRLVADALRLLGGAGQFVKAGQKVVIKPNLVHQPALAQFAPDASASAKRAAVREEFTTDLRIVRALAEQLRKAAACQVTVAEGTPDSATKMFEFLGYGDLAAGLGVRLVDVDRAERMAVKVDGLGRTEYAMPAVTQTCDVLVDVAAMKTHVLTGVSLGMKNLFGLLPRPKGQFHDKVHEVICDLSLMRKPDLAVIDGLVAMEGQGPVSGAAVEMDLLIAGRDVVAVDAVACAVMGIDPRRVKHLRLAAERRIGEADLAKIEVKGASIESVRRPFKRATWDAEVRVKASEALIGRLVGLAPKIEKHWKGGSTIMTFASGLKPDRARHPEREPGGFTVRIPPGGDEIVFLVPYDVLFEEHGQAACDEMAAWIRRKLGEDVEMTASPARSREAY